MKALSKKLRGLDAAINKACPDQYWTLFSFLVIGLLYVLLHENFAKYNIDDAWVTSFAYYYSKFGSTEEVVFGAGFGGVKFFGLLFVWLESFVLEIFGWTRTNAILISTFSLVASSILWFKISKYYALSPSGRLLVSFSILLWEPFLKMGASARPDAFVFFLVSSSLLLFLRGNILLAAIVSGLAFEVHPIGFVGYVFIVGHMASSLLQNKKTLKEMTSPIIRLIIGGLTALAIYLALHGEHLAQLSSGVSGARDAAHPLYAYFFKTRYLRHLIEIPIFLIAIIALYRQNRAYLTSPVFVSLVMTTLFMALLGRGNPLYVSFAFVWLAIALCQFFDTQKLVRLGYISLACLLVPQYLLINHLNDNFNFDQYIGGLEAIVPDDDNPVIGESVEWYGFQDRKFYSIRRLRDDPDFLDKLLSQNKAVYQILPGDPQLDYYPNSSPTHADHIHKTLIAVTHAGGRRTKIIQLTNEPSDAPGKRD